MVFVDEIDTTLRLGFTDDFFASIRYLYNERASNKNLARLSFVLLGVASPGDLMKDTERTPFNIGQRVDLNDFTEDEALRDLRTHKSKPQPSSVVTVSQSDFGSAKGLLPISGRTQHKVCASWRVANQPQ